MNLIIDFWHQHQGAIVGVLGCGVFGLILLLFNPTVRDAFRGVEPTFVEGSIVRRSVQGTDFGDIQRIHVVISGQGERVVRVPRGMVVAGQQTVCLRQVSGNMRKDRYLLKNVGKCTGASSDAAA